MTTMSIETDTRQIRTAYDVLAERPNSPVGLLQIYYMLDMTKEQFHAALRALARTEKVYLEPEPKLRRLTAEDHEIAVRLGGESKHLLSIEQ